jgi:hypothetical protein
MLSVVVPGVIVPSVVAPKIQLNRTLLNVAKKTFFGGKNLRIGGIKTSDGFRQTAPLQSSHGKPGACTINLFTAVIYGFSYKASRVFVPGKPFQPGLMFPGKARAYPSEAPLG